MLDAQNKRAAARTLNDLYWRGSCATTEHATRLRNLVKRGAISTEDAGFPMQFLHEAGGPKFVSSMLDLLERGKGARVWAWLNRIGTADVLQPRPFLMEFDLVAQCAFAQLGYGLPHNAEDGPLHGDLSFTKLAEEFPPFTSEPVDVRAALPQFDWPIAVLSGDRDLRTPRVIAEQIVASAPNAVLIPVLQHGHSALDTAQDLALEAIGNIGGTSDVSPARLSNLSGSRSTIARLISLRLRMARHLPRRAS